MVVVVSVIVCRDVTATDPGADRPLPRSVASGFVDDAPRPPQRPVNLGPEDPLAGLNRWVAEGSVDAAARARTRQRWLERQAAEEATVSGVLIDLAERGRPLALTTATGHRSLGPVVAIGVDFVVVREDRLGDVVIPLSRLATVKAAPGDGAPTGDRPLGFEIMLADALVELAADRPMVVAAVGSEEIRGELRSAGFDVVAVALDGPRRDLIHISMATLDHLVILSR